MFRSVSFRQILLSVGHPTAVAELSDSSFVVIEYRHPSDSSPPLSDSPVATMSPGTSEAELAGLARAGSAQVLQQQAASGPGKGSQSTTDMLRAATAGHSGTGAAGGGSSEALAHKVKSSELLSK